MRETERLSKRARHAEAAQRGTVRLDADSRRLQEELCESLGAMVRLKPRRGGKGSLVIATRAG